MLTLSHGFFKPESGDKGAVFFPALEANFQQLNDHTHNGVNSERLSSASVQTVQQSILSAAWVSLGGGYYRQLVTMPAGLLFTDYMPAFKDSSDRVLILRVEKNSANTYYVYINDNSLDLMANYLS